MLKTAVDRLRRAHHVKERVVEGVSEVSGKHSMSGMNASAVEGDGMGSALGKPASSAEGSSMQVGACEVGCDSVNRLAGETPDWPSICSDRCTHMRGLLNGSRDGRSLAGDAGGC